MWVKVVAAAAALVVVCASPGPQLWRVEVPGHHRLVRSLEEDGDVDVWRHARDHVQVLVEAEAKERVGRALDEASVAHSVEVEDVMVLVEAERNHMEEHKRKKRETGESNFWTTYHDLDEIEDLEEWLVAQSGGLVRRMSAARTVEGRDVNVLRITNPQATGNKKRIWIEGGIHAREWISPAVTTFLMHEVAMNPQWREILNATEWYFVPVANPDGYHYSFSSHSARLWRKNRRSNGENVRCRGVDLNRNWNLKWGVGASSSPCKETYKGISPFSEPETAGLKNVMQQVGDIDLFITFHSYGQTVLYPWGWTISPPANVKQLSRMARKFTDTVKAASGNRVEYDSGGSGPLYGLASGASDDWAYGALQVPFSYTIELPDKGFYGFLLPENQVSSTVVETTAGVHCMVSYLTNIGPCARRRSNHPNFQGFWG